MTVVVGVDGFRSGWCCVPIEVEGDRCRPLEPHIFGSFAEVLQTDAKVICVDVPIGLLNGPGRRKCDVEAKRLLGDRRASVFWPPARPTLSRRTHLSANLANRRFTGDGLSAQAFGFLPKICEVDHFMTPALQKSVNEVHPELCFWALNGRSPVIPSKKSPEGQQERWDLLRSWKVLPDLPPQPEPLPWAKKHCTPDDYIDALVAAWSAVCVLRRQANRIPARPECDERGLSMEMWYPAA